MKILKSLAIALAAISSTQAVELDGAAQLDNTYRPYSKGCPFLHYTHGNYICISKDCGTYCLVEGNEARKRSMYCKICTNEDVKPKKKPSWFWSWTIGGKSSLMGEAVGYAKDAAKHLGTGMAGDADWCALDDRVGIVGCAAKEEKMTGGWRFNQEDDEWDHDWSGLWTLYSSRRSIMNHE